MPMISETLPHLLRCCALTVALWVGAPADARATNMAWCGYTGDVGTPVCAYTTLDQCVRSARGCFENDVPDARAQATRPQWRRMAHVSGAPVLVDVAVWD